jgi:hypothetical protein
MEEIIELVVNSKNRLDCLEAFCQNETDPMLIAAFKDMLYSGAYSRIKKEHAWRLTGLGKELK